MDIRVIGLLKVELRSFVNSTYSIYVGDSYEGTVYLNPEGWGDRTHDQKFDTPEEATWFILQCRGFVPWPEEDEE